MYNNKLTLMHIYLNNELRQFAETNTEYEYLIKHLDTNWIYLCAPFKAFGVSTKWNPLEGE